MTKKLSWLLVSSPSANFHYFPLGLAYISAVLKHDGCTVNCLDLSASSIQEDAERIGRAIAEHQPDVIGVSGLSRDFNRIRGILVAAKRQAPHIISVVGGGGVSSDPLVFAEALQVDYGVIGEGEDTVVELTGALAQNTPAGEIPGIVYRDEAGRYCVSRERRGTRDLESLPIPDYDGFKLREYLDLQKPGYTGSGGWDTHNDTPRAIPVVFSRSCPFLCTFCYHAVAKYRERSLDSIFEEIEFLRQNYDINMLGIYDDLFALKRDRLREFCERIKKTGLSWGCQIRVNIVDEELLALMRDSGCVGISYGFESFSAKVLESMKKKIHASDIAEAAEYTYKAKIDIQANFIFGDFAEDFTTANETLTWWFNNPKYAVSLSGLDVYPGAEIYRRAVTEGIIKDPLEYLENNCPLTNLTTIDPNILAPFFRMLYLGSYATHMPANLLAVNVVTIKEEQRLSAKVVCPHCGETIDYGNLPLANIQVICKLCKGRFGLPLSLLIGRGAIESNTPRLQKSLSCLQGGDIFGAASEAKAALDDIPYDNDAQHILGLAFLIGGHPQLAVPKLQAALQASPYNPQIHINLSAAYLVEGWHGWALLHARQALLIEPTSAPAKHNADLAYQLGCEGDLLRFMPAGPTVPFAQVQVTIPELGRRPTPTTLQPLRLGNSIMDDYSVPRAAVPEPAVMTGS